MKHEVGEVDEGREHVLRQVVDAIVGQGQSQQVGQTVEGAVVEELNEVAGQVQHPQVVDVDERLTVQRLRSHIHPSVHLIWWRRSVVVSALASIDVVNRHWARLVLG